MPLTKVSFSVIQVANNVTSTTVGNTTSIPSFTFDQNGVITSASNTAISGAGITANTVANSAFQTGSVENYLRGANLNFGMRNRIINGAMVIDQRNAGASISAVDNAFAVDRWRIEDAAGSGSKGNVQQNQDSVTPPAGFTNYVGFTTTSAYSVGVNDTYAFQQRLEGFNTADLDFGKATAKTITLSFWVRSSLTGTFGGSLRNNAANRSYPFTYTITTANTWEYETITIAGDTTGTWVGATNGLGILLSLSLGAGTNRSGTAGAWNANNNYSATGATSVVGTNGATFFLTGVQLEVGSTATSFDYRPYGTELQLCQRYYETSFDIGTAPANAVNDNFKGIASFGTSDSQSFSFKVYKRAAPTMTWYSSNVVGSPTAGQWQFLNAGSAWANGVATQTNRATMTQCSVYVNSSGQFSSGQASSITGNWAASAEL